MSRVHKIKIQQKVCFPFAAPLRSSPIQGRSEVYVQSCHPCSKPRGPFAGRDHDDCKVCTILSTGPDLPATAPHSLRGWQARRNTEMVLGLTLAHLKRRNLKRIFRPTYQRKCSVNTRCAIARTGAFVATSTDGVTSLPRPATALHHGTDACAHVHCYFTLENTADALIAIYQKLLREVPNPCRIRHIGDDAHSTRQGRFDD